LFVLESCSNKETLHMADHLHILWGAIESSESESEVESSESESEVETNLCAHPNYYAPKRRSFAGRKTQKYGHMDGIIFKEHSSDSEDERILAKDYSFRTKLASHRAAAYPDKKGCRRPSVASAETDTPCSTSQETDSENNKTEQSSTRGESEKNSDCNNELQMELTMTKLPGRQHLCQGQRQRYKKFLMRLRKQIEADPLAFDMESVQMPYFISSNEAMKAIAISSLTNTLKKLGLCKEP